MPIYKKHLNQIIASTQLDRQGEKMMKENLESFVAQCPDRMPLNQKHDMSQVTVGYMENFRLTPNKEDINEWNIIADIYITSEDADSALRGFSFTASTTIGGNTESPEYSIHIPYPHYNDQKYIDELIEQDHKLLVGKLIKKAADPVSLAIITGLLSIVIGAEWSIQYEKRIRPNLKRLIELLPKLKEKKNRNRLYTANSR